MKTIRQKLITALTAAVACFLLIPTAAADHVIADDCIIQGSICVGFDCVNGESFGFDTLRLKENNLRIRAMDTSSTASFPTRDWQITFNDTSNGGAEKFAIDDIDGGRTPFTIIAGAPSNSLFVSSAGRVGLGTATPAVNLHVKTGNTPTLRLEQDGTSGFTAQTWDVAGNEANFFVRDVTNGSKLPLRITPNSPTDSIRIFTNEIKYKAGSAMNFTMGADGMSVLNNNDAFTKLILKRGAVATWEFAILANNSFVFNRFDDGSPVQATFASNGNLTLTGDIITNRCAAPSGCGPADFVFAPGYEIESIEDHASFMWENSHLPAIGKGKMENIPLLKMSDAIVEELEKAHIYIERLNEQLKQKETEVDEMSNRLARLEAVVLSK